MSFGSEHSPDRIAALKGTLEDSRSANVDSIGPAVAKLPVDTFIKHVLPPLHESFTPAKVNKILAGLKSKHRGQRSAAYFARGQRWTAFDDVEKPTEYATYQALVTISNQIIAEVERILKSKCPERLFDFVNEGNSTPVSVMRDSTSKPDGYFVLREEYRQTKGKPKSAAKAKEREKEKAHWMDIGPTGEYKLDDTEGAVKDDLKKILWNVTHTMREDARRRFTFAFTIEDTTMHFWYASRADIIMSDSFDFMDKPEILVRFFLSFLYATEAEAGWDPTMECVWDESTLQHVITVHDKERVSHRYKTVELLSSIGAGSLRGRGTRVWKVVPYGEASAGKPLASKTEPTELVLKDCWVDRDAEKEGDIVDAIVADAEERAKHWAEIVAQYEGNPKELEEYPDEVKFTKDDLDKLRQCILMPSLHGEVLLAGRQPDKTLDRTNLWLGDNVPYHYLWRSASQSDAKSDALRTTLQNQLKGEHRSVYLGVDGRQKPVMYNAKVHYRVVFEEVCETIKDEMFLDRIYTYLSKTCQALELIHKAGWAHRDISSGNVFIYQQGAVKLGDFEYAKRLSTSGERSEDIRTGTLDFMAVEVQQTTYLFRSTSPKARTRPAQTNSRPADGPLKDVKKSFVQRRTAPPLVKWFYNPIHDMESVLWLALFFTLNKDVQFLDKADNKTSIPNTVAIDFCDDSVDPETVEDRRKRITNQDGYSRTLFLQTTGRHNALRLDVDQWSQYLHPVLVKAGLADTLNEIRYKLVNRYEEVERDLSDATATQILVGKELYDDMIFDLEELCARVEAVSVRSALTDLARAATRGASPHASATAESQVTRDLQNMSLQDGPADVAATALPSGKKAQTGGSDPTQAQGPSRNRINPALDTSPSEPPVGASKTGKLPTTARKQAAPTAPTRIQPKRNVPKTPQPDVEPPLRELSPSQSSGSSGKKKNDKKKGRAKRG